jgi:hypothetical protein
MIHYLDQACIFCFKAIFEIGYEDNQLDFESYFHMKLMSKSEDEQIVAYANKVLEKNENVITTEKILSYNIPAFIQSIPREIAHQFSHLSTEFIQEYPETKSYLFE